MKKYFYHTVDMRHRIKPLYYRGGEAYGIDLTLEKRVKFLFLRWWEPSDIIGWKRIYQGFDSINLEAECNELLAEYNRSIARSVNRTLKIFEAIDKI